MSFRFFLSFREWPRAIQQRLSHLDHLPESGEPGIIDFKVGPPHDGRLPLQIRVDGRKTFLFELSDAFPSFPRELRGWMERCLVLDRNGVFHPEILTLDGANCILTVVMIHAGWDGLATSKGPVSLFIALRSDRKEPVVYCFCYHLVTIRTLYKAFMDCFCHYRDHFNDPRVWYDVRRYDRLSRESTSDRLLGQLRSPTVEKKCDVFSKNRSL